MAGRSATAVGSVRWGCAARLVMGGSLVGSVQPAPRGAIAQRPTCVIGGDREEVPGLGLWDEDGAVAG